MPKNVVGRADHATVGHFPNAFRTVIRVTPAR